MTPEELNRNFDKIIKDTQTGTALTMVGIATTAFILLRDRVQKTGVDAKGNKYKSYSTKPMLIGAKSFPVDKAKQVFGSKAKRKELEWRTLGEGNTARRLAILQGGYRQWRQIYGAQVDHVDFMVSGRMWANIGIVSTGSDHAKGVAIIGGKEDQAKDKLKGNTARRGDILDLSENEIQILCQKYEKIQLQIIKANGL